MENTRRLFIKKAGVAGMVATPFPAMASAIYPAPTVQSSTSEKGPVVLFQGDSITDGNRTRDNDWNHVMGHGYACLAASRLWYDYPEQKLSFYNRGISGNRIGDLEKRWQQDTLDLKPDVVSILIGVNDVLAIVNNNHPEPAAQFADSYKRVLDKTLTALPNVTIVLCEPFILPLGWVNHRKEVWLEEIAQQQQMVRELAASYKTLFVSLQEPFQKACEIAPADYWIWDGVHPMPAGHELIARLWIKEVSRKLTFIRS